MSRVANANHPTKQALLACAVELLDTRQPEEISVDLVCSTSGISLGSLYHHFNDLPNLLDHALVFRFARYVDASIEWLNQALSSSKTKDEFFAGLRRVTRGTQDRALAPARRERAGVVVRAMRSDSLKAALGLEQQRLNKEIALVVAGAQERGWVATDIDPVATAVFIQTYTLGRIIDDVTTEPMDDEKWVALIDKVAEAAIRAV